jgi:hypothetical protein
MADCLYGVQNISATTQMTRAATASPTTLGIRGVSTLATESLPLSVKGLPLLEDLKGGAHLLWRTEEQGAVFVGSSPSMFSNELIGGDDNLPLLMNLLEQVDGGNVLFDEYHHGYHEAPPLTTPYARRVLAALGVQLLLVGGVFLVSRSRRFGPLKGRPRVSRRRSLEFVDALAELYRRGRAGGHAAARLYEDFREEMCRDLRLPHGATAEQLAGAMARRTGRSGPAIARALRDAERAAADQRTSPRRLLAVARVLTELKKEVNAS